MENGLKPTVEPIAVRLVTEVLIQSPYVGGVRPIKRPGIGQGPGRGEADHRLG